MIDPLADLRRVIGELERTLWRTATDSITLPAKQLTDWKVQLQDVAAALTRVKADAS
jgi:hypothetical protein